MTLMFAYIPEHIFVQQQHRRANDKKYFEFFLYPYKRSDKKYLQDEVDAKGKCFVF